MNTVMKQYIQKALPSAMTFVCWILQWVSWNEYVATMTTAFAVRQKMSNEQQCSQYHKHIITLAMSQCSNVLLVLCYNGKPLRNKTLQLLQ